MRRHVFADVALDVLVAFCGRSGHVVISGDPTPGASSMPLSLTTEELGLLLALAAPIDQRNEINFCTRWRPSLRLTGKPARSESVRCTGWRARFSGDFSIRRSCPTPRPASAAPEGRSPESEHYGDAAIYRSVERPGFFASASVGANPSPTKARRAWPGCRWC